MHHEATFKRLLYSLGQSHLGFMLESKVLKFMVKISSTVEVNSVYKLGFPELCSWFLQIPWLWWLDQDVTFGMYKQRVGECEAAGGARTCLRPWFST